MTLYLGAMTLYLGAVLLLSSVWVAERVAKEIAVGKRLRREDDL